MSTFLAPSHLLAGIIMLTLRLLVLLLVAAASLPLDAQTVPDGRTDLRGRIVEVMGQRDIPGLTVAVVEAGRLSMLEGFGTADLEWRTLAGAGTVYEIGSVTKPFTAAAVQLLVRDGRLELSSPVSRYLKGLPSAWRDVTLLQLLQHTSGIPNYTSGDDVALFRSRLSRQEVIERVSKEPLEFEPGTRHRYSNTNYHLLGMVVEEVAGVDLWSFLEDRIFEPLDMTATGPTRPREIVPRRAEGYRREDGALRNVDVVDPETVFAAGGLHSTAVDLVRWIMALEGEEVLTAPELDAAWSPGERSAGTLFGYGLGWSLQDAFGHRAAYHVGATAGFEATLLLLPDDDVGVVVLANMYRAGTLSLAWTIAAEYVDGVLPRQLAARPDLETEGLRLVAEALRALGRREVEHPRVSEAFAAGLKGEYAFFLDGLERAVQEGTRLELLWLEDVTAYGPRRFSHDVQRVAYYRATTGGEVWHLHVHLTAGGRIADIDLSR